VRFQKKEKVGCDWVLFYIKYIWYFELIVGVIQFVINERIGVLLQTTNFILDAVLIPAIIIKDYFINHHLFQR